MMLSTILNKGHDYDINKDDDNDDDEDNDDDNDDSGGKGAGYMTRRTGMGGRDPDQCYIIHSWKFWEKELGESWLARSLDNSVPVSGYDS